VTGDEAAKASAAVTAKDSAVSVTSVPKDPDGSHDLLGTKAGAPVIFDVSADLATVTQSIMGAGPRSAAPGARAPAAPAAPGSCGIAGRPRQLGAARRGCISVDVWRA
jgi:hypothetical protein